MGVEPELGELQEVLCRLPGYGEAFDLEGAPGPATVTWRGSPRGPMDIQLPMDRPALRDGLAKLQACLDPTAEGLGIYERNSRDEFLRLVTDWPARLLGAESYQPIERWALVAWLLETATEVLATLALSGDVEADLAQPPALRARFHVLAEPFRGGWTLGAAVYFCDSDELAWRARRARQAWYQMLRSYEDRPLLTAMSSGLVEEDFRLLVFARAARPRRKESLALDAGPVVESGSAPTTAADARAQVLRGQASFRGHAARDLFLPRFMLVDCYRLVAPVKRAWRWCSLAPIVVLVASVGTVVLGAAETWQTRSYLRGAAILALIGYALLACSVLLAGRKAAYPWCLRMPASSAIGLVALLNIAKPWTTGRVSPVPAVVLGVVSLGYLAVEARQHDAAFWPSLRRGVLVWLLGILHAAAVGMITLAFLAPAFVNPWIVPGRWSRLLSILATGAVGGLAVGVFLQVLWEDRPITYPLTHLEWRKRS